MPDWAAKRFWTTAGVEDIPEGWRIRLDGRAVRTPAGAGLVLPSEALARAVAAEWDAQEDLVDPATMPMTRTANSSIDKVVPQRRAIIAMLADYGETDLLSYRAEAPESLAARQADAWDPFLDWAAGRFGARLAVTRGVMPVEQDPAAVGRLARPMEAMSDFRLAAFHDLVALTGSLVLSHAAVDDGFDPEEIWRHSRIDEEWQIEAWGRDAEAEEVTAARRRDFRDALRFWALAV